VTLPVWTTNPFTPLSMSDIEVEFVGNRQELPINLSDYYRDSYTGYVTDDRVGYPLGIETAIPRISETISISNFYGASSISYTISTDQVSYDEGDVVIFTITAPLQDESVLYWSIEDATVRISLAPEVLPNASRNIQYSPQQLTASGGVGPYNFSVTYGAVPTGMTLAANGLLSGRPTTIGTSLFAVTAADSDNNSGFKTYSLVVQPVPITITPTQLPNALVNVPYTGSIVAIDGTPPYVYSIASGFLPPGMIMSNTGVITGTVGNVGASTFTVRAQDVNTNFGTRQYTLQVQNVAISIGPTDLITAKINAFYSVTISAINGTAPYAFSLVVGSLPTGITLDPQTGILSGRPTQIGTFIFGIKVTDFNFNFAIKDFELSVENISMIILPSEVPNGTINVTYPTTTFAAQGGTSPYNFTIQQGTIPTGLTFDNGILSGKPTVAGSFLFKMRATDADNNIKDEDFTMVISSVAIFVSPNTIPDGTVTAPYNATFTASGGLAPYTFRLFSGGLPTGLSLSNASITGTPTAFGVWTFSIEARDANTNTGRTQYSVTIFPATMGPTSIPSAIANADYMVQLGIENPYGSYTFSTDLELPNGLELSPDGLISGVPIAIGPAVISVSATSDLDETVVISKRYDFSVQPSQWIIEETTKGFAPITVIDGAPMIFRVTAPTSVNPLAIVKLVAKVGTVTVASTMIPLTNYIGTAPILVTKSMLPAGVDTVTIRIENGTGYNVATYGQVTIQENNQ
jgi:hypothetical protein